MHEGEPGVSRKAEGAHAGHRLLAGRVRDGPWPEPAVKEEGADLIHTSNLNEKGSLKGDRLEFAGGFDGDEIPVGVGG